MTGPKWQWRWSSTATLSAKMQTTQSVIISWMKGMNGSFFGLAEMIWHMKVNFTGRLTSKGSVSPVGYRKNRVIMRTNTRKIVWMLSSSMGHQYRISTVDGNKSGWTRMLRIKRCCGMMRLVILNIPLYANGLVKILANKPSVVLFDCNTSTKGTKTCGLQKQKNLQFLNPKFLNMLQIGAVDYLLPQRLPLITLSGHISATSLKITAQNVHLFHTDVRKKNFFKLLITDISSLGTLRYDIAPLTTTSSLKTITRLF